MNKNRMILAVSGGVIGLAVLAMAYFNWCAYSAKVAALEGDDEGNDGLEAVQSKAQALSRKSVYPSAASVQAIDANTARLADWRASALKLASPGDRPIRKMTRMPSWRFAVVRVVTRQPCLQATSTGCMSSIAKRRDGKWPYRASAKGQQVVSRRSSSRSVARRPTES